MRKHSTFKAHDKVDRLQAMILFQKGFASKFIPFEKLTEPDVEYWIKDIARCINVESNELLNETNWKHWKKTKKEFNKETTKDELMDILIFAINGCLVLGMSEEDIFQRFIGKVKVNYERQEKNY